MEGKMSFLQKKKEEKMLHQLQVASNNMYFSRQINRYRALREEIRVFETKETSLLLYHYSFTL